MKIFTNRCLKTTLLFILLTAFASCRLISNDLREQRLPGQEDVYNVNLKAGTAAKALVSSNPFKSLLVEVQYVRGFAPSTEALNDLQRFLEEYLDKPGGIEITASPIPSPGGGPYSIYDVRSVEDRLRRKRTVKDQIAVYILFLDGQSSDNFGGSKMLGQAHRSTSIVVYENTLREAVAERQGQLWIMEATIMEHEFGHLLGLVNSGAPMESDHQEENHPSHCKEACLMHHTTDTQEAIAQMKTSPPPLDENCKKDLKALVGTK